MNATSETKPPNGGSLHPVVRLLLKAKTTKAKAEQIRSAINGVYPAWLLGKRGIWEVRFRVPSGDTRHIWLLLLIKDSKDIKRIKQSNE